ncbi:MAG: hypothetical protein LBJ09_01280 [Clostridiales bacterium]|nr:hypothetical protein [Clostridiales bacterium]
MMVSKQKYKTFDDIKQDMSPRLKNVVENSTEAFLKGELLDVLNPNLVREILFLTKEITKEKFLEQQ